MKKVFVVMLSFVVVLGLACPVFAAGSVAVCNVSDNVLSCGETVTVTVNLSSCPSVQTFGLALVFDDAVFEFVSGNWLVSAGFHDFNADNREGVLLSTSPVNINGDVFSFVLKVKETAPAGKTSIQCDIPQQYAVASSPTVVEVQPAKSPLGDVNGDGVTNSDDAVAILRHLAGYAVDGNIALGDYNSDGTTNSDDAVAILRMLAGYND